MLFFICICQRPGILWSFRFLIILFMLHVQNRFSRLLDESGTFYFMDLSMQLLYLRTFKPSTAAVKIPYQSEKWWETCRELQSLNSILKVVHNGGCHAVKFHFCRSERFHYQRVLRKTLFFFTVFPVCLPRHWLGRKKMLMCTIVVFSWKAQQFISSRYVILVVTIFTPQITNGKEQNVTW